MDLQYEILKVLFKGRNFFAPLKEPLKILDIGTGTGKWAIEMGRFAPHLVGLASADNDRQLFPTSRGRQPDIMRLPSLTITR